MPSNKPQETQAEAQASQAESIVDTGVAPKAKVTEADTSLPRLPAELTRGDRTILARTPADYYKALYDGFKAKA